MFTCSRRVKHKEFSKPFLLLTAKASVTAWLAMLGLSLGMFWSGGSAQGEPAQFGLGRAATDEEIQAWNIDVSPNGNGLPAGQGTVHEGAKVYAHRCAGCHGHTGIEGPNNRLVGGKGTLDSGHPLKTVGSYWPYATTLFDYIYRAMPFTAPQSLTPDDVYALVAWILYRNDIVEKTAVINRRTLPAIRMPNRNGFQHDPRPDVSSAISSGQ